MGTAVKILIIEDEEPARNLVKNYLQGEPDAELVGECSDGFDGFKTIQEKKPDLIFLDVQMPKLTGFELLEILENPPAIIFTTAYDEYAIKAFEMNAVDYLLKPFSRDRFHEALMKAKDRISKQDKNQQHQLEELIGKVHNEKTNVDRLVVKSGSKLVLIPAENIYYFEAEDDYVMIYSKEGKHLKQLTMKYLEDHLDPKEFVRIHRSNIVRVDQVERLEHFAKDNYLAIMKNGAKLRVSDSGYKNLKSVLKF
jgi:two-component system, LytTR family, response regulator